MGSIEKIEKLKRDLKENEELAEQFERKAQEARNSGKYTSDREVVTVAANALGYDLTQADFERAEASTEKLDRSELTTVAGGWCWKNNKCGYVYKTDDEDKYGHSNFCMTLWHCLAVSLHTDTGVNHDSYIGDEACWKDYRCLMAYMDGHGQPIL